MQCDNADWYGCGLSQNPKRKGGLSRMDSEFKSFWRQQAKQTTTIMNNNYSPIYASLPLHCVALFRKPFSWLISCFFWQSAHYESYVCNDIESRSSQSWAYRLCLFHLLNLCGDDCVSCHEYGIISLKEMEAQAESNLRPTPQPSELTWCRIVSKIMSEQVILRLMPLRCRLPRVMS